MEAARKDLVGTHIGQYRILKKIGSGGMGTIYAGEHILLGRRAAIKVLLPMLSTHPEIVDRFFKEARATSAITDPGVVQIFDFGYHVDGTAYIVMELLKGEALSDRIGRLGRLTPAEALRVARQLAGALAAAHANHIVHRDLKPENVFIVADPESPTGERVKLLDFGICKMVDDATQTQTGRMMGTPVYMSPEQCQGTREVDGRADIYSLGCVLFHALTGRVPFDLEGTGDLIVAHMQTPAPVPTEVSPDLPELVNEIVAHCLAKDPDERFQTMAAVQHAIDQVLPKLTPAPLRDIPATMALGEGFNSNLGSDPDARATPNEPGWFVHEMPTPTMTGELHRPHSSGRSLVAILVSGLVVALIVAAVMQTHRPENEEQQLATIAAALPTETSPIAMPEAPKPAPPTPEPFPSLDPDRRATPTPDPLPAPEIDDTPAAEPEIKETPGNEPEIEKQDPATPDTTEPELPKPEQDKPNEPAVKQTKPVNKPGYRARPRPQQQTAPAPKQPSDEDLYETR